MPTEIELCRYCTDIPLTQCEVQEHWERRLKSCNLPTNDVVADPARVRMKVDGEMLDRLVPLTGSHEELVDVSCLPSGWHSPFSGDVESRAGITTYRDLNIWERCASPRENSAGEQIHRAANSPAFVARVRSEALAVLAHTPDCHRTLPL